MNFVCWWTAGEERMEFGGDSGIMYVKWIQVSRAELLAGWWRDRWFGLVKGVAAESFTEAYELACVREGLRTTEVRQTVILLGGGKRVKEGTFERAAIVNN